MNRFLSNNLPWKIVSLVLATMLWIFVINTQDPILKKVLPKLEVDIMGIEAIESKGFILTNEEELRNLDVRVVVNGPRLEIEELMASDNKLEIRIDLTAIANKLTSEDIGGERVALVQVVGDKGKLEIEEFSPTTIIARLDKETQETREVTYNITGANNEEYIPREPVLKPDKVELIGPQEKLKEITKAVVDINIENFSKDVITYKLPVKLLDENNQLVTGVKVEPEQIEVVLPIGKQKQVPLEAQFTGALPNGYVKSNVIITPETVNIIGPSNIIDSVESVKLEPIVLDNMIESDTFQVDVVLPNGVERFDTNDIVVTVEIQKEIPYEYTIDTTQLKLDVLGLPEGYDMDILQPTLSVSLLGTPENLLGFNAKDVQATLDLGQLGEVKPGIYSIPIRIQIPDKVKLVEQDGVPLRLDVEIINPEEVFDEEDNLEGEEGTEGEGDTDSTVDPEGENPNPEGDGNTDKPTEDSEDGQNTEEENVTPE